MNNDLNEKYFETKRKHKDSYNKRGYLVWIMLGLGALAFILAREYSQQKKHNNKREKVVKELVEQGKLSATDTLYTSTLSGTQILVLENCIYKEFDDTFVSIRNDSSGLVYVTKRIIADADYSSTIKQWESRIKTTEPSYVFTDLKKDSAGNTFIETASVTLKSSNNADMMGTIKMTKKGGLIYMLQIVALTDKWPVLTDDIRKVEQSYKIID